MSGPKPFLVVDNDRFGSDDFLAVCVASLEGVGRTTGQLGSEAAGAAAVEFEKRLSGLLRAGDQLIQIHEGKHCLLIRALKDRNHAALAGLKLERLFAEPFLYRGHMVPLHVRAGIACGPNADSDAETLFRAAETAREAARHQERIYELAEESVLADMHRRWQLNDEVDAGLFNHEIKLYYQPKVAASDHALVGAEGLVRWERADGLLNPGQFLPHLERDKMLALTRHVVRQCIRDLAANPWLPPLSVNLDPEAMEDSSVVSLILDELAIWNVDPLRLVVEVTEHGMMRDAVNMAEDFARLRARGVRIAMDDFGTGHSSLGQFRTLQVDELKIDRSFILEIDKRKENDYLTRVIVNLGHYFGMSVVAEGVETREAAELLRDAECDVLQGFYFSPPLPLDSLFRWVEDRTPPDRCA